MEMEIAFELIQQKIWDELDMALYMATITYDARKKGFDDGYEAGSQAGFKIGYDNGFEAGAENEAYRNVATWEN